MSRIYKAPPLAEAVCEFRFDPTQPWDWTLPGLLYARLGADAYPHKEQQNVLEVAMQPGAQEVTQHLKGGMARMRFLNQTRTRMVQIGPDLLAVHCLRDYAGWPQFRQWVADVLGQYVEVGNPESVSRLGLRYINHIKIPQVRVEIEDYLQAVPHIPEPVPQVFAPFMLRVEVPIPERSSRLVIQSGSIAAAGFEGVAFLLDLDCITEATASIAIEETAGRIEEAHVVVEEAFEACLGPKARILFQEVTSDGDSSG